MSHEQAASEAGAKPSSKTKRLGKKGRSGGKQVTKTSRNPEKMIAAAREKIDNKRPKDAVILLKRALSVQRNNAIAMALLGKSYHLQRKFKEARKMIERALEVDPIDPEIHVCHGRILHSFGELDAAANAFTHALKLNPQFGDGYRELGVLLIDAGILDQATEAMIMAIKLHPQDAVAYYHLGLIKKMQGHDTEAIDAYAVAVGIKPDYAEAHVNLAKIAIDHGKHELGQKSCLRAIEADPTLAQAYINMGMVLREQKKFEEAYDYAKRGAELDPQSGAAQSNYGNVLMDLHRYQEAVVAFRKAMEYQPSFATSYFNYGNALRLLHVLEKAHAAYDKALELEPERGEFQHNKGLVYQEQGQHAAALAQFRLAHELTPEHLGLEFSLARSLWNNGFYEESWEHFDAGLAGELRKPNRRFQVPRWRGEDIQDKRILVWREQGVGDEIDFARRFRQMIDTAGTVLIEADRRLVPIFQRSFPEAKLLPERLDGQNDWNRDDIDLYLPAGNLMQYFPFSQEELDLATSYPDDDVEAAFACQRSGIGYEGYLTPDPERVAEMAERIAGLPDGPKIGICWRSMFSHRDRDIHYTDLEMWEPILTIPGVSFINVQYDPREDEICAIEDQFKVKIHRWDDLDLRMDLEGAFALTSQLDLVISTSSSPNRIADAVGTEIWLMMAGASQTEQPVAGDFGLPNRMVWQRHWTEEWPVLLARVARAFKARLDAGSI